MDVVKEDRNREDMISALTRLREIDPAGWEKWFSEVVPEFHQFVGDEFERALAIVMVHIDELTEGCKLGYSQLDDIGFGSFGPM